MEVTLLFVVVLSLCMIILAVRVLDLRGSPVTKSFHKPDRQIDPKDLERAIWIANQIDKKELSYDNIPNIIALAHEWDKIFLK